MITKMNLSYKLICALACSFILIFNSCEEDVIPDNVGVEYGDAFGGRGIIRWQDLFGAQNNDNSFDAVVPFGGPEFAGLWNEGNPAGGRVPYFQFHSTTFTGQMQVPGTPLRNTDYTIAAVVSRTGISPDDDTPVYWFWGDSFTEGRTIRIGFDDSNTVSISHGGSTKDFF